MTTPLCFHVMHFVQRPHTCGHEVPRRILLCYLKGAMRLDRRKDMSMHVSTCISYDFKPLKPVVWKLWR
jgi:hypothetical protein